MLVKVVNALARTTLMVNNAVVMHPNPFVRLNPSLPWPPPSVEEGCEATRVIPFRVWKLKDIHVLAQQVLDGAGVPIKAITTGCIDDMQAEQLDAEDAARLILSLTDKEYINSQWCKTGAGGSGRPELCWAPCDAYIAKLPENRITGTAAVDYYIKFSLNSMGNLIMLISLHRPKFPKRTTHD